MDNGLFLELLGYVASILVAVSLMMSSILRLRIINLVGAIFFVLYASLIGAYPVVIVNSLITLINLYYLYQIFSAKEFFGFLEVSHDSEYLQSFLDFHSAEIGKYIPDFSYIPSPDLMTLFILRDMVPAGIFIAEPRPDGSLYVHLDFVTSSYRDFKSGRFLYRQIADFLFQKGIHHIYSSPGSKLYNEYLVKMGFNLTDSDADKQIYRRDIQVLPEKDSGDFHKH